MLLFDLFLSFGKGIMMTWSSTRFTGTRRVPAVAAITGGLCMGLLLNAGAQEYYDTSLQCPILDTPAATYAGMSVDYAPATASTAAGWEDVAVVSAALWGELLFLENDWGGDFVTRVHWDTMVLQGFDGGDSGYPLTMANLFLQYSQRYVNGYGLRVDASPGLYTVLDDASGDAFSVPFGLTAIKAVSPGYALFIGASAYPGFDMVVDPRLGIRWKNDDYMVFDLAYPETRLTLRATAAVHLYLGGRYLSWPEYAMGDDKRERLRYREGRLFGGLEIDFTKNMRFELEGGYLAERQIEFEAASGDVTLEDGGYASLGVSWLM